MFLPISEGKLNKIKEICQAEIVKSTNMAHPFKVNKQICLEK